ncbi:class F sortase [Quadrisphaera sp. DSM 44207]|uniref:class F sortase n=1 Tax=Quadrisphaera sp. DSM 44207 TaxID=1881057 RepID=UPI000888F05C|nr:class F sortase [Quadrisphaera sp. DSM 44207]SDQ34254.1 Sortase family protein [Quadrisphaera sp. DSM 44207]
MPSVLGRRGGRRLAAASAAAGVTGVVLLTTALDGTAPPAPPAAAALPAPAGSTAPSSPAAPPAAPPTLPATAAPGSDPAREEVPRDALPASTPTRVRVPDLGVDTALVTLGLQPSGEMEVPDGGELVGWYEHSPTPGQVGPTVLAGHVSWNGEPAVFFELGALVAGQLVEVDREDGATATYRVTGVEQHPKDAFPTLRVYGNTGGPQLRLITCGGAFDASAGHHRDNVVVYAELASVRPA